MFKILLNGQIVNYSVSTNKNQRTIRITVTSENQLAISTPVNCSPATVEMVIRRKTRWIINRLAAISKAAANPVNKSLTEGAKILYHGEVYLLNIKPAVNNRLTVNVLPDRQLEVMVPLKYHNNSAYLHNGLRQWYITRAKTEFLVTTDYWGEKIGVKPKTITIRDQKTRWGSCSGRGNISYNWRVIMAPRSVADYLVVHELCHLRLLNHSPEFWQLVKSFIPEFRQQRNWLKENDLLLNSFLAR